MLTGKKVFIMAVMIALLTMVGTRIVQAGQIYIEFDEVLVTKASDWESPKRERYYGEERTAISIDYLENVGKTYCAWVEEDASGYNVSETIEFSMTLGGATRYFKYKEKCRNYNYDARLIRL